MKTPPKTLPKIFHEQKKRNAKIVKERKEGASYNYLAFKYQVSPQRIRSIALKAEEKKSKK